MGRRQERRDAPRWWHVSHNRYVVDEDNVLIADCYADTALDFGVPFDKQVLANAREIVKAHNDKLEQP